MNDRVVRLRYQDFKEVFAEQMRISLGHEGRKSFESDLRRMRGSSECGLKGECTRHLEEAMDKVMEHLEKGRMDEAAKVVEETQALLCGTDSPCHDDSCSRSAIETVQKIKLLLGFYQGLRQRITVSSNDLSLADSAKREATPESVEAALSPLSNSWRLRIMLMLKEGDRSLSEISRYLDMRTGHLQFHIKSLRNAGFIASDRRTKAYSLTHKGERALEGAMRLASDL
ncbi:MAG: winged helix-turn-helix domain-containing protein [Methanomassiliicoccales archaeon]|nr:winged helix-turn-helix domain-containing protein [Methanomassiliicoccales archaeon]MDD1755799.1 winged helix-turn-helix domain-containing protein [Methanomassiliicoccales archaeon]